MGVIITKHPFYRVIAMIKQVNVCKTIRGVTDAWMVSAVLVSWARYLVNPFSLETPIYQFRAIFLIYFIDDFYLPFSLFSVFWSSLFGCWIACPGPLIVLSFLFYFCLYYQLCSLFLQPYYWVQFLFSESFCFYRLHVLVLWLQYLLLSSWRCYNGSLFFFNFSSMQIVCYFLQECSPVSVYLFVVICLPR